MNSAELCCCRHLIKLLIMRAQTPYDNSAKFRHNSTWLILPVVICLSCRLSHACLSVNTLQWNCGWLITTVIVCTGKLSTDIRGNSTVNTYHKTSVVSHITVKRWQGLPCSGILLCKNRTSYESPSEFLTHQVSTVGYWLTVPITGNGGLGFDPGEGAWDMATTSKEGSRRANYLSLTQGGSK